MSKKFRCGRLLKTRDGSVRKLNLSQGGGCRDFLFDHLDMDFDYIRDKLIELFDLDSTDSSSYSLYDFQLRPLDLERYVTFLEYIQRNGLKFNNTLLYLCNRNTRLEKKKKKATKKTKTTTTKEVRPKKAKPEVIKVEDDEIKDESPLETNMVVASMGVLQISPPLSSFSVYSYQQGSIELVDRVRHAMTQPNHCQSIILRLYEYVCAILTQTSSTLDQMRDQIQRGYFHRLLSNDQRMFSDTLNNVEDTCRLVRTWIETHREQILQVISFPDIMKTFVDFNENLIILRKKWIEHLKNNDQQERLAQLVPLMSVSSSRVNQPTCRHRRTTRRLQKPACSRSTTRRCESAAPPLTNREEQTFEDEKHHYYRRLSTALQDLLNISRRERSMYLYGAAKSAVDELQSRLSNARFDDHVSLRESERKIDAVKTRLSRKLNDRVNSSSRFKISEKQKEAFNQVKRLLRAIAFVIHRQASQAKVEPRQRSSRRSTPPRSSVVKNRAPVENRSPTQPPRQLTPNSRIVFIDDDDDDQSSMASASSIDDDMLLETATNAYQQLPKKKF